MKVQIDDDMNILWQDNKGQWWKRIGECNKCGECCRGCEWQEGDICTIKRDHCVTPYHCFIGPSPFWAYTPMDKWDLIKKKCSYTWEKYEGI